VRRSVVVAKHKPPLSLSLSLSLSVLASHRSRVQPRFSMRLSVAKEGGKRRGKGEKVRTSGAGDRKSPH